MKPICHRLVLSTASNATHIALMLRTGVRFHLKECEMDPNSNNNSAFVHKQWANALGNFLQMFVGAIQLIVLTVGTVGFSLLDLVLGSFVLSKLGLHGASLDLLFVVVPISGGFIALLISAALSAAKLGAWDALLSGKVPTKTTATMAILVMVVASALDVIINVAFAGYFVRGVVPQDIISSQAGILETVLAISLGILTMFDAPMLVQLIHHLRNNK